MSKDKDVIKLDDVLKIVAKKYGEGAVVDYGSDILIQNIERVSTGLPSLDLILGGGLAKGRIAEIFGNFAGGKTSLSLHILANIQKAFPKKKVLFLDVENALDIEYAKKIGVDEKGLLLSQPSSGEEAMDIIEKVSQTNQVSAIVVDSVAQLVPMAVGNKEIDGTANMATTARLLSQTLPRISNAVARSGVILIFINQVRSSLSMYGEPMIATGGYALKFAASVRIEVRSTKPEVRNGKEGCPVIVKLKKNKLGKPFTSAELFLNFGEGFDYFDNLIETAVQLGVITQAGAWYAYNEIKGQGLQGIKDVLRLEENAMVVKELEEVLFNSYS